MFLFFLFCCCCCFIFSYFITCNEEICAIDHRTQEVRFLDFLLLTPLECSINLKLCYRSVIDECLPPTSTPLPFHQNGLFPCLCCPEQLFLWRMFSSAFQGCFSFSSPAEILNRGDAVQWIISFLLPFVVFLLVCLFLFIGKDHIWSCWQSLQQSVLGSFANTGSVKALMR